MKHIVVCCDLSDDSVTALSVASDYARHFRETAPKVTLLFVVDTPASYVAPVGVGPAWVDLEPMVHEIEKRAKIALQKVGEQYFSEFPVSIEVKRSVQAVYEEILAFAEAERADLIVMAKHGKSAMQRFLLGSVTTKIVQLAHCPVLVVPVPKASEAQIKAV